MKNMSSPILITGAARSGTSMVAGAIHLCGAFGGRMSGSNRNNAKGMFENSEIRNRVVKPFLQGLEVDPMGQHPLPTIAQCENAISHEDFVKTWRNRIGRIMCEHGYGGGPWFYKGAKMCLMWPVWHAAFPDAKWVIVRRNSVDIADSCLHTGFMRAFRDREGWLTWLSEHYKRFGEMRKAGLNIREIWPERIILGNFDELKILIEWLGLEWRRDRILDFVAPPLWKHAKYSAKE